MITCSVLVQACQEADIKTKLDKQEIYQGKHKRRWEEGERGGRESLYSAHDIGLTPTEGEREGRRIESEDL